MEISLKFIALLTLALFGGFVRSASAVADPIERLLKPDAWFDARYKPAGAPEKWAPEGVSRFLLDRGFDERAALAFLQQGINGRHFQDMKTVSEIKAVLDTVPTTDARGGLPSAVAYDILQLRKQLFRCHIGSFTKLFLYGTTEPFMSMLSSVKRFFMLRWISSFWYFADCVLWSGIYQSVQLFNVLGLTSSSPVCGDLRMAPCESFPCYVLFEEGQSNLSLFFDVLFMLMVVPCLCCMRFCGGPRKSS